MHENNVNVHNSKMYGGRVPFSYLSPNRTCSEMMINQHHHNLYILLSRGGGTHCLFYGGWFLTDCDHVHKPMIMSQCFSENDSVNESHHSPKLNTGV